MTRILTGMTLAGMTLALLCSACAARAADCTPLAMVKTDALFDGRVLVPVTLENHPLTLLLDTGGIATTLKWDQARQLGLGVKQAVRTLTGVGGSVLNFTLAGENFSVGGLRLRNLPIYVEARVMPGADGTLAPDILRGYDVAMDFGRHSLSLFAPDGCAGDAARADAGASVVAMDVAPNGHIRIPVKIDGKSLVATLDTGAWTTILSMKTAALLGIDPRSPKLNLQPGFGNYRAYSYPFQTLEIGRTAIQNPRISIADDGLIPGLDSDLVLGIDALRHMRLTIDYGQNRLYLAPAN
jgi:predicted aspartyl protease